MASINYIFEVRNNGTLTPGLTPAFIAWNRISDGTAVTAPTITELKPVSGSGAGLYTFAWDAELSAECAGVIDAGATLAANSDRFITAAAFRDSSRVLTALANAAPGTTGGVPAVDSTGGVGLTATAIAAIDAAIMDASNGVDIFTVRQALAIGLAMDIGKVSGATATGGTAIVRNPGDTKNVITMTTDVNGNRSNVTTTP